MGRERQGGGVWTAPLEEKGGGGGGRHFLNSGGGAPPPPATPSRPGVQTHLETHAPLREAHQRP
jgi:hypothetical protein